MFALGKVNKNSVKSLSVVCVWKNRRASAFPWALKPVTHTRTQAFHRVTFKYKTKRKGGGGEIISSPSNQRRKAFTTENIFCPFLPEKIFFIDKAEIEFSFEEIVILSDKFYLCSYVSMSCFSPSDTSFFSLPCFFFKSVIKMIWHVKLRMNQTLCEDFFPTAKYQVIKNVYNLGEIYTIIAVLISINEVHFG